MMSETYDELGLFRDNAADAGLPWTGPPTVRRETVLLPDGRHLSALVWGTGEPALVLIHGSAQNGHTWDTVALALGLALVAIDLPGHGHSDWRPDHDYRPAVLAEDVAVGVAALAPQARLVVGMSLGGLTSIALAARHPDLVRRLVLVDITPGVDAGKSKAINEFISGPERFESFDALLERTVRHNQGRSESSLRRGILHNAKALPSGEWTWRWDPQRTMGNQADGNIGFARLWDDLAGLRTPLTLLRGGDSPVVDDADVAELRRRRPDAEVVVVDGAGHSIQGDQPLEVAALITRALEAG
jgi:pimeloyl-ACP methyl ester carboxylesterase